MRKPFPTMCLTALLTLAPTLNAQASVTPPDTPAGRVLAAWVFALNDANKFKIQAFVEVYWPGQTVTEAWLGRGRSTGGYDIAGVVESAPDRIVAQLRTHADTGKYEKITIALVPNVRDRVATLTIGPGEAPKPAGPIYSGAADNAVTRTGAPYKQFTAWLDAYNSGDRARLQAFIDTAWPTGLIDGELVLRARDSGFELVSLETATPATLVGTIKGKNDGQYRRFTMTLRPSDPAQVERFFTTTGGGSAMAVAPRPDSLSTPARGGLPLHSPVIEALSARLLRDVTTDDVGAMSAAVVSGDSVVWTDAFGWADRDRRVRATPNTVFRVGSISKTVTALVMAQLVDRRIITLDDPIERYLPEIQSVGNPQPGAKPVTFRQLANHTGALGGQGAASPAGAVSAFESSVLTALPKFSYSSEPGTRYAYSNVNYGVLGLALSRAAGVPFPKLVEDGIFKPLGMTSTTYELTPAQRASVARGYTLGASGLPDTAASSRQHAGIGWGIPAGGLYSTASDMARFIAALSGAGPRIVSDSMREAMMTKQTPEAGPAGYGFGLQLPAPENGVIAVSHGGAIDGYTGAFAFDPVSKVGLVVLRNYGTQPLLPFARQMVVDLVAGRVRDP
jgi:CubicO group peptidase (beta-lactamase class C family)